MSTAARIGIKNADGTITSIYTHFDGYPEAIWPTLTKHYATEDAIRPLIALGDLSCLREKIGEKHKYGQGPDDVCHAYGRDRGEKNVGSVKHAAADPWPDYGQVYEYLFEEGSWKYRRLNGKWHDSHEVKP